MKNQEPALVFVSDLFFQAKIAATARAVSGPIRLIPSAEALLEECLGQPGSLVIVDLAAAGVDPISLIRTIKKERGNTGPPRIVGFHSHVNKELERNAREAGCDLVLSKSVFTKRLPEILTGAFSIG